MNIIKTENLTKKFGKTTAVDRVSMHVDRGEIYGFLGLNGAGKTTTIRLLLGLIRPDAGNCLLFGKNPNKAANIWNDVGYLIEIPHAYPELSVIENLQVVCRMRNLSDLSLIDQIINKLKLGPYKHKKEKHLSMGNKQRLGLAKALIHKPRLLLLDEPVNGLDPAGIVEVRELLKDLSENHNTTIFLSSHILSEIARLTSRIGIIHNGVLIKEMKTSDLKNHIIKKLLISTRENDKAMLILRDKGFDATIRDGKIELNNEDLINNPNKAASILVKENVNLMQLYIFEEDLEHYFLRTINPVNNEASVTGLSG